MNAVTNFIDEKLINAKVRLNKMAEKFLSEERGAADLVVILIVVVIVLAVAAIFRDALFQLVNSVVERLDIFVNETGVGE